jgi:uncharacterized membrane protein required for colicin V production
MALIDLVLIVIIIGFLATGIGLGFGRMIGNLLGMIGAIFLATQMSEFVFSLFGGYFSGSPYGKIIVFIIVLTALSKIIGLLLWALGKALRLLIWIPFVGLFDRMLGAGLGLIEAGVAILGLLYFAGQSIPAEILLPILKTSAAANWLLFLLPMVSSVAPQIIETTSATMRGVKDKVQEIKF